MQLPTKLVITGAMEDALLRQKINDLITYLEAKENFHSETKEPMFKAEELEDDQIYESEDGKWILQAVYYKEFETEEAAREALLKLKK